MHPVHYSMQIIHFIHIDGHCYSRLRKTNEITKGADNQKIGAGNLTIFALRRHAG